MSTAKELDRIARRAGWSLSTLNDRMRDFIRTADLDNYPEMSRDLVRYVQQQADEEELAKSIITQSIWIEHCGPGKFRILVFESNWQGTTSVLDIAEAGQLSVLKKWLKFAHPDIRCVRVNGDNIEVADAFFAATAMMHFQ